MTGIGVDAVTLRSADRADATRLSLIANATFLETFAGQIAGNALVNHCKDAHAPACFEHVLSQGGKAWLAEWDGAPVGYALIAPPVLDAAEPGDAELKKIYLLSRFHGTGLARRLLDAALRGADGHARLLLGVKADNARAIAFYEKQRFRLIDTRRFDVGGTLYDDVVLARDLQPELTR